MTGRCVECVTFEVDGVEFEAYVKGYGEINCYSELVDSVDSVEISEMYSIGGAKENLETDYFELYKSDMDFHYKIEKAIKDKLSKTGKFEAVLWK